VPSPKNIHSAALAWQTASRACATPAHRLAPGSGKAVRIPARRNFVRASSDAILAIAPDRHPAVPLAPLNARRRRTPA